MPAKLTIRDMQSLAKAKGGKCLSRKYINAYTKLLWKCANGDVWFATPQNIKNGGWCRKCFSESRKSGIETMKKVAASRGGACLSKQYANARTNLKWKCRLGHVWFATPNNVQRGRWCPECSAGKSERICRRMFEILFNCNFKKVRPKWLRNSRGNIMELDGYCEKLGIALEYQGGQHYKHSNQFHAQRTLSQLMSDDKLKKTLCSRRGIILIEVPFDVSYEDMPSYIERQCKKRGIKLPNTRKKLKFKLFNVYSPEMLKEIIAIAKAHGGQCLSKKYINDRTNLKFSCANNHIWWARPRNIKDGHWCHVCGGSKRLTLNEVRAIAKKHGGKCLSKTYLNNATPMQWRCKKGHTWTAKAAGILQGQWCPDCAKRPHLTIDDMRELARAKGGICLSNTYRNAHTKLTWKCANGHIWTGLPCNVRQGHWCRQCVDDQKRGSRK